MKYPKPLGPYVASRKTKNKNELIFCSGQIGLDENGEIKEDIKLQTTQVLKNIQGVLSEHNLTLEDVLKTTIFLTNMGDFEAVNQIYGSFFKPPYPARSTIEVRALPKGAKIEIEVIAQS
ncbi:MAG: Rid family detoxifying hydrolase [Helicobacter sp.]|nr:Rid family detoxifying hydrolase [Helicobacter sp.]